ncbi:MAG: nitroreductase [Phenylobacterium sp.]|uniref:nitroreductase family protein n=1 Tax=Phenylobacterium sp. TaxID=1871053 RepID=UPI003918F8FD
MAISLPDPAPLGAPLPLSARPEVLEFLATRRSATALTLAAPGPEEAELDILLRLAARVPDHGKLTPWRMIVLSPSAKTEFAARLEALAQGRGDAKAVTKLGKLKAPPMGVAVISRPQLGDIPEWEQLMSAGAVCANLLYAATAMGYGANWITDWYAYDPDAMRILGLEAGERVAGFIFIGTAKEPPLERDRPDWRRLVTAWTA